MHVTPLEAILIGECFCISCVRDKDCYLKWLTKLLKESKKYLEKYPRERSVPLHNERVGKLS